MTANILGGTPRRARTSHRRVRSTESYALVTSIKYNYKGVSFFHASSCSRPRQFLQSSYCEHHVNHRALGSEPTLFLRKNILAFAIVTQATRDYIEDYFAGVSHEGDATIIATLSSSFLFLKHLNCCIFPLLRRATAPPHSDDNIVELSESVEFSFVGQSLQELGREIIGPTAFWFANARIASSTSYLDGTSSSGLHGGHCLSSSTMLGSRFGDLV